MLRCISTFEGGGGGVWFETHLVAVLLEEPGGVHAISDGAADEGEPVEDHWGLIGVLEEDLAEHVEDHGQEDHPSEHDGHLHTEAESQEVLGQRMGRHLLEKTHDFLLQNGIRRAWILYAHDCSKNLGRELKGESVSMCRWVEFRGGENQILILNYTDGGRCWIGGSDPPRLGPWPKSLVPGP